MARTISDHWTWRSTRIELGGSQLNGRKIRGAFHRDHLKPFHERTGYLATGETFEQSQTVRRRRTRGGMPRGLNGGER